MRVETLKARGLRMTLGLGLLSAACFSSQQFVIVAAEPSDPAANIAPGEERAAARDRAVKLAQTDLQQRAKAPADKIVVISADSLLWLDTSMGCGSPTASYAQIEREGFQVVLEYEGKRYDYRSFMDGAPVLCEQKVSTR
jgi:hypothetical protein